MIRKTERERASLLGGVGDYWELYIDDRYCRRDARTVCFAYKPTPLEGVRAVVDGILAG
jgi:hypothetical protein